MTAQTWRKLLVKLLITTAAMVCVGSAAATEKPEDGDIRGMHIGMHVEDINNANYERVSCARLDGDGSTQADIAKVSAFADCPADASGLISVQVHYAAIEPWSKISDRFQGTKLAGHPVNLYVRISSEGIVQALLAETDPQARRYMRKKAFLLTLRIKGRYGRENWTCSKDTPNDQKHRVGGMFIDETCKKQLDGRQLIVHTRLYRKAGQGPKDFVGSTIFEILGPNVESS